MLEVKSDSVAWNICLLTCIVAGLALNVAIVAVEGVIIGQSRCENVITNILSYLNLLKLIAYVGFRNISLIICYHIHYFAFSLRFGWLIIWKKILLFFNFYYEFFSFILYKVIYF